MVALLQSRLPFVVGNGLRVKFWREVCCLDAPLCVSFPSRFALASSKEVSVGECWSNHGEGEGWNP